MLENMQIMKYFIYFLALWSSSATQMICRCFCHVWGLRKSTLKHHKCGTWVYACIYTLRLVVSCNYEWIRRLRFYVFYVYESFYISSLTLIVTKFNPVPTVLMLTCDPDHTCSYMSIKSFLNIYLNIYKIFYTFSFPHYSYYRNSPF